MRLAALFLFTLPLLSLGCAEALPPPPGVEGPLIGEASDANPNEERLTLRAGRHVFRGVRLEGERLWGPQHEIEHFPGDGYRGKTPRGLFFVTEHDAGRLTGTVGGRAVLARGFGIALDHETLVVRGRFCEDVYRRIPNTEIFHGTPGCWQSGFYGADFHIPEAFFKRPAGEQVVFLTAFLS